MVKRLVLGLLALPVCLALVQLLGFCSAHFAVVGHPEPILAMVGEDAVLPCHLSPKMSTETMELMWERPSPRQVVHTYAHGQEDTPAAEFRGRTSILREDITAGKAALRIRDVRASDRGTYLCYFQDKGFYERAQVELKVAALGSDPHIKMKGYEAGGIHLECTSAGWYPQPQIQWTDARGHSLSAEVATEAADPQGLYAASASVILGGSSGENVSCVVRNPLLGQERSARLSIPGPFFQSVQPWKAAFTVTLPTLLLVLGGLGSCLWQQQKKTRVLSQEKKRERAEREAAQAEERWERSAKERLRDELRWRKIPLLPRKKRSQAYAELKTALFQPADVFLDPDTAHPALRVSEDKRSLQWTETWENLPDNPKRFCGNHCVLGCESFTSGRHFWEVAVRSGDEWHVGVCRENVKRKGVEMRPRNGFWVLGQCSWKYFTGVTKSKNELPLLLPLEKLGVFLDYEMGEVSFYNASNGAHLFTFPPASFSGPLRPVFNIQDFFPLTICPAQKAVRRSLVPDLGPYPSLETLVSLGSADRNGDPQAEEMSLLLTAQPEAEGLLNHKTSQQEGTEDIEKGPAATF